MSVEENKVDRKAMGGQGKQITDQRGFCWIRAQMMQQVLSSINEEKRAARFPTQMELLKLFPENRTPLEHEKIALKCPPFADEVTDSRSVSEISAEKQSSADLTIFYNGPVKVYHVSADMAQAVMKLAHSNDLSERATLKPSHGEKQEWREVTAGLGMAKKLSLQRFLQKRKDRVETLNPYKSTCMKKTRSKVWAEEGGEESEQISLSLSLCRRRHVDEVEV